MPETKPAINPWIIAISVMLGTFMEVLDTTVVNVSLQHIAGSLSVTPEEATWVLTSYLVANAIVLPLTGWLGNYFGRRNILLMSVGGFTVFSFLCGIAPNLPLLIIFRVFQGATGGGLQPLSQAILMEAFPPEKRAKAMAFWALGIVVAPMLGPVLGGWITDSYSWRWLFYINIPIGIAAVIMALLFIHDPPYIKRGEGGVDYWGIGYLALGIGALQIMLDKGQEEDWFGSHFILTLAILCVIGFVFFVVRELITGHPVVELRIFKNRTYATGVFLMTVLGFVLYGSTVLLPLWLQTLMGYSALEAGMAMLPRGLGSFLFMPIVGILMGKIEARKLLAAGLIISSFSIWQLSKLNLNAGYWDIFWPQLLQGCPWDCCLCRSPPHQRPDSQRANGQRHQPVQPDAQHRRQYRHCQRHHDFVAPCSDPHQYPWGKRNSLQSAGTNHDGPDESRFHGPRHGRRHRHQTSRCRTLRHGPATSRHDGLCRCLLSSGRSCSPPACRSF